jgi:hydrogenase expression/formation protein HypD
MVEYKKILSDIYRKSAEIKKPIRFMELCGTHSESVAKYAIKSVLPKNITLVSGPGCPVCVTDQEDIDIIVGLAASGVPVACYGDAANVPGNLGSLEEARQNGADVNIVYEIEEALRLKKEKPELVFWGLGFETTAVATAWAIKKGMTVFSSHKLFPPAMVALLKNKKIKVDGFIDPGHVSAIIGTRVYEKFSIPQVVAGFEALDVLCAIDMLLAQLIGKERKVQNEYTRLVKEDGNKKALALIEDVFEIRDARWRGLGTIKKSGLRLKKKYQKQDAEFIYRDKIVKIRKSVKSVPSACRCADVLQGIIEPKECPLFEKVCTPDNPQGACMVSREGSCNISYRFK